MKAIAVAEPERRAWRIYMEVGPRSEYAQTRLFQTQDGVVHEVEQGAEPPMYMRLDEQIAKAIIEAVDDRPSHTEREVWALEGHRDDAIEVRDRLLNLVERGAQSLEILDGGS